MNPTWSRWKSELFYGVNGQIMVMTYAVNGVSFHAEKARSGPKRAIRPGESAGCSTFTQTESGSPWRRPANLERQRSGPDHDDSEFLRRTPSPSDEAIDRLGQRGLRPWSISDDTTATLTSESRYASRRSGNTNRTENSPLRLNHIDARQMWRCRRSEDEA